MNFEEIKKNDEMKELYIFEQKILTKALINEKAFKKYGILNKEWIEKYKKTYNYNLYIKNKKINFNPNENIFKIDNLIPKLEILDLNDDEKIKIYIHDDFVLVSEKFIGLISKNFENELERKRLLNLCCEALKTKNGIIIQDMKENMILYYRGNNIFKIKFILKYLIHNYMSKELEMILQQGFGNYLNKRKHNLLKQKICNDNGEKIGYFYSSSYQVNNNLIMNFNKEKNINVDKLKEKFFLLNKKLNSIFLCLYQIEDLKQRNLINNDINQNEAIKILSEFLQNFQTQRNESFNKIHNFFRIDIFSQYRKIITFVFDKLNPPKILDNKNILDNQFNQTIQYDEGEEKNKFIKNNKTDSIIQNLFYCIKEKTILCSKCNLKVYKFAYIPFISIRSKIKNKLEDIIFKVSNKEDKVVCNFCSGIETVCTTSIKITDFPRILIVILENTDYENFHLGEYVNIINNNIRYVLFSFIDHHNDVYFKKSNGWKVYDKNYNEQKIEKFDNINPIVLFYELKKNNADNHTFSNNINNSNINLNNNINNNNRNNINNNHSNISCSNSNNKNFMPNAMNNGTSNKMNQIININGYGVYNNNINQNNMKIFNNVNLMNNSNNNIQRNNINNIIFL